MSPRRRTLSDSRLQKLTEPSTTFMGVLFSAPMVGYIDQLVKVGLHGHDRPEVCVTLIRQGIAQAVTDGLLTIPKPKRRR